MGEYKYKAVDSSGKPRAGVVKDATKERARSQLTRMRFRVISIQEVSADSGEDADLLVSLFGGRLQIDRKGNINISGGDNQKISDKELIIFTKQLATMISSGVPLNQTMHILARQQTNRRFMKIIDAVKNGIEQGQKFSDSLEQHKNAFDTLYVAMARAGEESGRLSDILMKLVVYVEKSAKMKQQIKSAMMYPLVILFVAIVVVAGLLIFVVPAFASQFKGAGRALPALTQSVMDLSDFLVQRWYVLFGGLFVMGFALSKWLETKQGREAFHRFALKAPIVGDVVRKVCVGRLCSTLSSMLSSGVNIIQALSICAASAGNVVVERIIIAARGRVEQGQLLSVPLSESPLFPIMVISMMEVGERAGKMDEMLSKVSEFYEEEVDQAVKTMLSLIEPLMIVFIGAIVGVLVIAMYLPILDLGNTVGE